MSSLLFSFLVRLFCNYHPFHSSALLPCFLFALCSYPLCLPSQLSRFLTFCLYVSTISLFCFPFFLLSFLFPPPTHRYYSFFISSYLCAYYFFPSSSCLAFYISPFLFLLPISLFIPIFFPLPPTYFSPFLVLVLSLPFLSDIFFSLFFFVRV